MESQQEIMPRWKLMSELISDVLQDEQLQQNIRNYSNEQKLSFLLEYGFTNDDLVLVIEDLKKVSGLGFGLASQERFEISGPVFGLLNDKLSMMESPMFALGHFWF